MDIGERAAPGGIVATLASPTVDKEDAHYAAGWRATRLAGDGVAEPMAKERIGIVLAEVDRLLAAFADSTPSSRLAREPQDPGTMLLAKGLLDEAAETYRVQAERPGHGRYAYCFALFDHLRRQVSWLEANRCPPRPAGTPAPVLISIPVWGSPYIRAMEAALLSSLRAPGNLPALAQRHEVIIELSTRDSDAEIIRKSLPFEALGRIRGVSASIVPYPDVIFAGQNEVHGFTYRIMGAMHHMAIQRARALGGMHVVFLGSDFILSDGLLGRAIAEIENGYGLVLTAPMKARLDGVLPAIRDDPNVADDPGVIAVPARRLTNLAIRHMHAESRQLVVSKATRPFGKLPFPLYFPRADGFSVRSFVLHPLVAAAGLVVNDVMYDYNTVDGVFLDRILQGRDPDSVIKILADSDEGIFVDLCEARTVKEADIVPEFDLAHVIEWIYRWRKLGVEEVYRWLIRQEVRYRTDEDITSFGSPDISEEVTVAVISHVLERMG